MLSLYSKNNKGGPTMRKMLAIALAAMLLLGLLGACGGAGFDKAKEITVITREDGSGTRSAFIELFGIEEKLADGSKKDHTTKEAITAKQTDVMITNVTRNQYAIGYISLGSMNDSVKALDIGGVRATVGNVKDGSYEIWRPFYVATKGETEGLAKDFIGFILSAEGQAVVTAKQHIPVDGSAPAYAGDKPEGKLRITGSSSVTPVMEKLREAYLALNPAATIEVQQSDSSGGLLDAQEGNCDIAMSSRDLKDSELAALIPVQIALDGIAVIVNLENPLDNLTKEQVKSIFTGETLVWDGVIA